MHVELALRVLFHFASREKGAVVEERSCWCALVGAWFVTMAVSWVAASFLPPHQIELDGGLL